MNKQYKVVNGTSYDARTSDEVIKVLENARANETRIKVYYGDVETGRDWHEGFDVMGYIGRSIGSIKIPILVAKRSSIGGGALLDHVIIKIRESKGSKVLYQAKNYIQSTFEIKEAVEHKDIYTHSVYIDGKLYSNHKSLVSAKRLVKKLS